MSPLKKLYFVLVLIFWPLSFYLGNLEFSFRNQTVFQKDYEREQLILRDTKLYKSIFMARMFHNKARIPLEKIQSNFFALVDPNNYFFAYHPRETPEYKNIQKFPFLSIFFFLTGLYYFKNIPHKKLLVLSTAASIGYLSILLSLQRADIILWPPISYIILHGLKSMQLKDYRENIFLVFCIVFAIIEILRILTT